AGICVGRSPAPRKGVLVAAIEPPRGASLRAGAVDLGILLDVRHIGVVLHGRELALIQRRGESVQRRRVQMPWVDAGDRRNGPRLGAALDEHDVLAGDPPLRRLHDWRRPLALLPSRGTRYR